MEIGFQLNASAGVEKNHIGHIWYHTLNFINDKTDFQRKIDWLQFVGWAYVLLGFITPVALA